MPAGPSKCRECFETAPRRRERESAAFGWHATAVPAGTVGPGYFAPMRADEFVASRIVEAVVHGIDLAQALGRESFATAEGISATAAILALLSAD